MNQLNPSQRLELLSDYPFDKLNQICPTNAQTLSLAAGEPTDQPSQKILNELVSTRYNKYPPLGAIDELRQAVVDYATRRFNLDQPLTPDHVAITCGSREGIYSLVSFLAKSDKIVAFCNPFYQIYMGASILNGLDYICLQKDDFRKCGDDVFSQIGMMILCSPDNPTGSSISAEDYSFLVGKAKKFEFTILVDECYIDIYNTDNTPPLGLLEYLDKNNIPLENMLVLHSLSKRCNAAGLRSAAVIGDKKILDKYRKFRTWYGVSMSLPIQNASIIAWQDDDFVARVRGKYQQRFAAFLNGMPLLFNQPLSQPSGSFYLWLEVGGDDRLFAEQLYKKTDVKVLPGSWLTMKQPPADFSISNFQQKQTKSWVNPSQGYIRVALVDSPEQCGRAAERLNEFVHEDWPKLQHLTVDHLPL